MCTKNQPKQSVVFTTEDFYSGKKFDYIVYEDRPDLRLNYYNEAGREFIKNGNKIIGEVEVYKHRVFQINIWILGQISVRYLNLDNCTHHKPVGHLIKSIKNRLNILKNVQNS